ncbi:MAG: transporter permease [Myxococcaceae bacterium]|nr:transporter permease [Myxococcaceae bacterium]
MTERRQGLLFVAPAVAVLAGVALYPILGTIWLSLHRSILVFHEHRFVGFDNWATLFEDARFWSALVTTLYFSAVAVSAELALGLLFALLLHGVFRGRGLLRAAVLVPWAIPTVVSARLWGWLFNPDHGLVARMLPGDEVNWLGTPGYALHAAIVVDVWKTTPFVALILLAGLQAIPVELGRAAALDGAGPLRILWSITLPLLRPALAVAAVFRGLDAMRVFDAVYVLTGGGPANTTETLSIYAYKTLMRSGDFGYGSTIAVATFVCVSVLAAIYLWLVVPTQEPA